MTSDDAPTDIPSANICSFRYPAAQFQLDDLLPEGRLDVRRPTKQCPLSQRLAGADA
jgi:hypothetical protein